MRAVCEAWSAAGRVPGAVCTELGMRIAWGVCVAVATAALLAVVVARRTAPAQHKTAAVAARPTRTHPTVLLLGGERAGKTNVFLRLAMDVAPPTATSQRVSEADVAASDRAPAMHLVDVPGHARLRHAAHAHLDDADALIAALHEAGIKVVIDIVPNHMGVGGADLGRTCGPVGRCGAGTDARLRRPAGRLGARGRAGDGACTARAHRGPAGRRYARGA